MSREQNPNPTCSLAATLQSYPGLLHLLERDTMRMNIIMLHLVATLLGAIKYNQIQMFCHEVYFLLRTLTIINYSINNCIILTFPTLHFWQSCWIATHCTGVLKWVLSVLYFMINIKSVPCSVLFIIYKIVTGLQPFLLTSATSSSASSFINNIIILHHKCWRWI